MRRGRILPPVAAAGKRSASPRRPGGISRAAEPLPFRARSESRYRDEVREEEQLAEGPIQTRFIRRRLESLDQQLTTARRRLESGGPAARVDAKGDIEVLAGRREALARRLAEIEADDGGSGALDRIQGEFSQDVAILEDDLKRWMDGLDEWRDERRP